MLFGETDIFFFTDQVFTLRVDIGIIKENGVVDA